MPGSVLESICGGGGLVARKILIVDDDLETVKLIGMMLERRGYEIAAAQTGSQALEKVQAGGVPDLIVLDVMMPDMDGYEVCRRLRANSATAEVPIIMFTAKTQLDDKVAGFQAGADDYLTKPVHPNELASRIEAVLLRTARRKTGGAEPIMRAKLFGFLGAKGGVGTTTLATNLAVAFTQGAERDEKTFFADMQPGMTASSFQFGLRRAGAVARVLERPIGQIDARLLDAQLEEHRSGVFILSGQIEPIGAAMPMPPAYAEAIVSHLGAMADYLFLDMGVGLGETNRRLLPMCYQIVVTIEPQRACLMLAQALLNEMTESLNIARHRISLVLINKAASAASFTKEMIEGLLQHELAGVVTPAPELAFQSQENGIPMVISQPNSLVAQQIQSIAEYLLSV
ncbi:MAG: response regulator [Anaerolineae bacterium]|nr:response regulator [Anaerolineae bacterium]